jgi:hypothetical protein
MTQNENKVGDHAQKEEVREDACTATHPHATMNMQHAMKWWA